MTSRKIGITASISLMAALAMALLFLYATQGVASAGYSQQPAPPAVPQPASPEMTGDPITTERWDLLSPRDTSSFFSGGPNATEFDPSVLEKFEGGVNLKWTFPASYDAIGYKVERQLQDKFPGEANGWHLLSDYMSETAYEDITTAPGFSYTYRITPFDSNDNPGEPLERTFTSFPRDGFYAIGSETDTINLYIVPTKDFQNQSGPFRITRYDSPSDVTGTPERSRDKTRTDDGLVYGKIYKYVLEIMRSDGQGGWEPLQNVKTIYAIAGFAAMPGEPTGIMSDGTGGKGLTLTWEDPTNVDRSQFALYEVLRRNAKDWQSEFKVIGSTTGLRFTEQWSTEFDHFEYGIQPVSWEQLHKAIARGHISPDIPEPECLSVDKTSEPITHVHLQHGRDWLPLNKWIAFSPIAYYGDVDNRTKCRSFEMDDFYVQRAINLAHTVAGCSTPGTSCTKRSAELLGYDPRDGGYDYVPGRLRSVSDTLGYLYLVWHDDSGPTDNGLYRHVYKMCSYSDGGLCSDVFVSDFRWVGIDAIPFSE